MNLNRFFAGMLMVPILIAPVAGQDFKSFYALGHKNKQVFSSFKYDELVELSKTKQVTGELKEKLNFVLYNPVVDNTIAPQSQITLKEDPKVGKFIRVGSWNIQRGLNFDSIKLLFTDSDKVISTIKDKKEQEELKKEAEILKNSDIIVLNEVDVGMPRTGYRNIAEEFAKTIKYNYAYGVEFLEIDPVHLGLGDYRWSEEKFLFSKNEKIEIDKDKYKGLHGTIILSRFPLRNVRIIRLPDAYDWFDGEKKRISELEFVKRHAASKVFKEEMIREIRQGNRMALLADVTVPGLDTPVTIVATHLENRCVPKKRKLQLEVLLRCIQDIRNPVVMLGDFNTTTYDGAPTGIRREIMKKLKDPEFLAKTAITCTIPPVGMVNSGLFVTNFFRRHTDPTVKNIPIIAPNRERELFEMIKDLEFKDGYRFDFRGDRKRAFGSSGRLGNSNQRYIRGYTPTFIFERPIYVGKYKVDWIFVKAYSKHPRDKKASYNLAPYNGRTLFDLNYAFEVPFSDHAPITADLPIEEPKVQGKEATKK